MGQPTKPTQPSFPFGVGKRVVIRVIAWITRVEIIKRQTWAACYCMAARSKFRVRELSLRPIGCTRALSVTQSAGEAAVCGLWSYISDEPLPLPFTYLLTETTVTGSRLARATVSIHRVLLVAL